MPNRLDPPPTPRPAWLICLLFAGCQSYLPVTVRVVDGETQAPVPGATVESHYVTGLSFTRAAPSVATADADGRAVVRISNRQAYWRGAQASAHGYLEGLTIIPPDRFEQLWQNRRYDGDRAAEPADVTVELFREPHPSFLFVIPDGYRGLLRLDQSASTAQVRLAPGQRVLEVALTPPAAQQLPQVALGGQHRVGPQHFHARYANGTPIPRPTARASLKPEDVGLRSVAGHNMREMFVVGTAADHQAVRSQIRELFQDFPRIWDAADQATPAPQ